MLQRTRRSIVLGLSGIIVSLTILLSLNLLTVAFQTSQATPLRQQSLHRTRGVRPPLFTGHTPRFVTTTVPLSTGVSPRPRALAVDESLGLAYLADGDRGTVTIVAGTTFVSTIPAGQTVQDIAVDPGTGLVYASAPDPYALYDGHIAIIQGGKVMRRVMAGGTPGAVAVDTRHNRTYVSVKTDGPFDQVAVFQRDDLVAVVTVPPEVVALDVDPVRGRAYVVNRLFPHLTTIDGTLITAPPIPLDSVGVPRDLGVDPETGLVYVAGQPPFREIGTVVVISGTQQIAQLPTGPDPQHVAVDAQRGRVYVTNAGDNTVTIIAGTEVIGSATVGSLPGHIAVDSIRDRVYVSNAGNGTTTLLSGDAVEATLPAGGGPLAADTRYGIAYLAGDGLAVAQGGTLLGRLPKAAMPARVALNPQTGLVYVGNQGTDTLSVVSDTAVVATLPLISAPQEIAANPVSGWVYVAQAAGLSVLQGLVVSVTLPIPARDVALDPARDLAYAAGDGVAVIRGATYLGSVELGQPARGVAVHRTTGLAYATAGGDEDGFVAIISGTRRVDTVNVGGTPGRLVVDPVRDRVYVLHPTQGRLSLIEGTQRVFPNLLLPRPALDAAVNPVTGEVYVATRGPLVWIQDPRAGVIELGLEALAVAVDVERGFTYAATRDGQVAVLHGGDVLAVLPVGHRPTDLAIDPETGRVYVANFGSDTITIVERWRPPEVYLPLLRR